MTSAQSFIRCDVDFVHPGRQAGCLRAPFNVACWDMDEGATLTSSVRRRTILSLGSETGGKGRISVANVWR